MKIPGLPDPAENDPESLASVSEVSENSIGLKRVVEVSEEDSDSGVV